MKMEKYSKYHHRNYPFGFFYLSNMMIRNLFDNEVIQIVYAKQVNRIYNDIYEVLAWIIRRLGQL